MDQSDFGIIEFSRMFSNAVAHFRSEIRCNEIGARLNKLYFSTFQWKIYFHTVYSAHLCQPIQISVLSNTIEIQSFMIMNDFS